MNGIQINLTYEDRCELISDICKVYGYTSEYKKKLHKRSDKQLLAFRESMRERGMLSGYVKGPSIYMKAFLNLYSANTYYITADGKNTIFYVGVVEDLKKYQYGYIIIDNDWIVRKVEMYGEQIKRYNGLRLIIEGAK